MGEDEGIEVWIWRVNREIIAGTGRILCVFGGSKSGRSSHKGGHTALMRYSTT